MSMISIIIPCYNAERWIAETLHSVLKQEAKNLEVIIIDDGSTDGTSDVVKQVMPTAHLIRTPNRGCSAARQLGTERSMGEFIQYLDADDLLMPGKLQRQLSILQDAGADVAYGNWQRLIPKKNGEFVGGEVVSRELIDPEIDLFTTFWCPPAAYLFRRSIVEKVTWNEKLPVIQDARFALDCALHGGHFVRCDGLMAQYRDHASGSVSTRDPIAFNRDCFINAKEVKEWWLQHGGVTEKRRSALLSCFEMAARESYGRDQQTFTAVVIALNKLSPYYLPMQPKYFHTLSRWIGYPRAEAIRYIWTSLRRSKVWTPVRKIKKILQGVE